ncbi:MAG: TIM barrel protein [Solirubrobacteraceae bacterium]
MSLVFSAHISWLFGERPYLERVGAARRAGFRWIESAWPAEPDDRAQLPAKVAEHGVAVALLNCPAGDVEHGERGFANDPARREQLEQAFLAAAELAQRIGAGKLNLLVGRALPGVRLERQRTSVVEALRALAPEAAARGLRIVIEPLNAIENPGYLAPTPQDAAELIEAAGSDALGLLLDVYHVARVGADPLAAVERCAGLIGHVQIADFPGRGQPGSGALDIRGILEALDAVGYTGAVGLEYEPRGSSEASLAFLRSGWQPASL